MQLLHVLDADVRRRGVHVDPLSLPRIEVVAALFTNVHDVRDERVVLRVKVLAGQQSAYDLSFLSLLRKSMKGSQGQ